MLVTAIAVSFLVTCVVSDPSKSGLSIESTLKKFNIRGKEWKEAQQVINNLVDKSIANRVEQAEKDVEQLLENNISDHIKKTGKAFLAGQPNSGCRDTIEHCSVLFHSGVCRTSKAAMKKHCPKTCGMCDATLVKLSPHVKVVLKPKTKSMKQHRKKKPKAFKSKASGKIIQSKSNSEVVIPQDTLKALHSIEPLLLHHSKEAVKFSDNDIEKQTAKIHDAEKLLSDVKSLEALKDITGTTKSKVTKVHSKPKTSKSAAKSKVTKKKTSKKTIKSKAVPLKSLTKTVTYKNRKYKITPIVDWDKINKMLKALGFKAVNLVAGNSKIHGKHLEKHLKAHLSSKSGSKVINLSTKVPHAAAETFVSAVHRQKSYHNKEYSKKHCHPLCLVSCISSCGEGCCKEHDKVPVHTALAGHCHPECKQTCVPSCGSGCCSDDEEKKRGHHFLHYQRIHDYKTKAKDKPHVTVQKKKPQTKPKAQDKTHHHAKAVHPNVKVKPLKNLGKHWSEGLYNDRGQMIPQKRLCFAPCPEVCAPACADECCQYGRYSQAAQSQFNPASQTQHDSPLAPNVPFPGQRHIPAQAFACKESCKFRCSFDCPRDCCQPEDAAAIAARPTGPPPQPLQPQPQFQQYMPYVQPYAPMEANQVCPSPCPATCAPSCNVGCCTSALGLPQLPIADDSQGDSPANHIEARSSTRKVLHVTHVFRPVDGLKKSGISNKGACASSCGIHCTPACARSGCCDRV